MLEHQSIILKPRVFRVIIVAVRKYGGYPLHRISMADDPIGIRPFRLRRK